MQAPVVDLRQHSEFVKKHIEGSVSIPWNDFEERMHELPPKGSLLSYLMDQSVSPEEVTNRFLSHGYKIQDYFIDTPEMWNKFEAVNKVESGNTNHRLWVPNTFLEETIGTVEELLSVKNKYWSALDLGSGSGRDAIFLALRGWKVTAVDYLQELLDKALNVAKRYNCSIDTICVDLESTPHGKLAEQLPRVDLVHVARYLHRPLFPLIKQLINPGGFVVYHTFMTGVEKFGKPRRAKFILQEDELKELLLGYEVIVYKMSTIEDGRPVQCIVARKPP